MKCNTLDNKLLLEEKDNEEFASVDFAPIFFPNKNKQKVNSVLDNIALKQELNDKLR
jgi:hypothetical protein